MKGSIFPPPRLLTAGAPKLPTPRAEAALLTEHAQRGLEGCRGGAAWGGAAPPFRVFASAAERAREARAQSAAQPSDDFREWRRYKRQGRGQHKPRPLQKCQRPERSWVPGSEYTSSANVGALGVLGAATPALRQKSTAPPLWSVHSKDRQ